MLGGKEVAMSPGLLLLKLCAGAFDVCEVHPTDLSCWCHVDMRYRHGCTWHRYCLPASTKALFLGLLKAWDEGPWGQVLPPPFHR